MPRNQVVCQPHKLEYILKEIMLQVGGFFRFFFFSPTFSFNLRQLKPSAILWAKNVAKFEFQQPCLSHPIFPTFFKL